MRSTLLRLMPTISARLSPGVIDIVPRWNGNVYVINPHEFYNSLTKICLVFVSLSVTIHRVSRLIAYYDGCVQVLWVLAVFPRLTQDFTPLGVAEGKP